MDSILWIQSVLGASIRRSPNRFYKGQGLLSQSSATRREQLWRLELSRAEREDTFERVWMSQWLSTSACIRCFLLLWGWGAGGGCSKGLQRSSQPSGPAVTTFLESTQARFDFWRPHCVSVSPVKNISQSWSFKWPCSLVTYQPEKKSQKDGDSLGLFSVSECHYIAFSDGLLHVKESFAIWIVVPLCYVQFVPQV